MLPLSGVFYPVDALPGVLQPIARVLPTTHAFAASRSVLDGGGVPWERLGLAALASVALAAAGIVWVVAMLRVFRKRGYVTRYS
jgi:ABC-2 type transport system permease protein